MRGKQWVINPNEELPPVLEAKGFGSTPPVTLNHVLKETVRKFGNEKAMALKRPANVRSYTVVYSLCDVFVGSAPSRLAILDLERLLS
jgi:hypothetical protein